MKTPMSCKKERKGSGKGPLPGKVGRQRAPPLRLLPPAHFLEDACCNTPALLPWPCRDGLLSLTTGLDAVTAAAAGLGQPGTGSPGPLPTGQDLGGFVNDWLLLLGGAALVADHLFEFFGPCCSSEAERERLVASVTACIGAICAACGQLVQLWRERQSALASEATSRSLLDNTNECLRVAFDAICLRLRAVSAASNAGTDLAAVAQAAALSAQV